MYSSVLKLFTSIFISATLLSTGWATHQTHKSHTSTNKSSALIQSDQKPGVGNAPMANTDTVIASTLQTVKSITKQNPALNHEMVILGINAYNWAQKHNDVHNKRYLTLIDFTLPSNEKRLFVIDMHNYNTVLSIPVAHGKGSGDVYAKRFSNRAGSDATSLGVYSTGTIFSGKHGRALKLNGLEAGINNNAARRSIEIHCAAYVSQQFIQTHQRAGRSWGCFAVSPAICHKLVNMLAGGTVIFAYAKPEDHDPITSKPS